MTVLLPANSQWSRVALLFCILSILSETGRFNSLHLAVVLRRETRARGNGAAPSTTVDTPFSLSSTVDAQPPLDGSAISPDHLVPNAATDAARRAMILARVLATDRDGRKKWEHQFLDSDVRTRTRAFLFGLAGAGQGHKKKTDGDGAFWEQDVQDTRWARVLCPDIANWFAQVLFVEGFPPTPEHPVMTARAALSLTCLLSVLQSGEFKNVRWFLWAGSHLSAVLHGGFMGWDDDADIILRRDDEAAFLEVGGVLQVQPSLQLQSRLPQTHNRFSYKVRLSPTRIAYSFERC